MSERPDDDLCAWGRCRQHSDCLLAGVPFCRHHASIVLTSDGDFADDVQQACRREWEPFVKRPKDAHG